MKKYMVVYIFLFLLILPICVFGNEKDIPVCYTAEPILEYDCINNLGDGIFVATKIDRLRQTNTNYVLNSQGEVLSQFGDCQITNGGEGLLIVAGSSQNGFYDYQGNLIIPARSYSVFPFSDGFSRIEGNQEQGYREGFMNKDGDVKIPLRYDRAGDFQEGLARVEKNGRVGYIDTMGKVAISLQYSRGGDFSQGLACVQQNGRYGYIDKKGNVQIPFQFQFAGSFKNGKAFVRKDADVLIIDEKGNTLKKLQCGGIPHFIESPGYILTHDIIRYYNGEHEHVIRGFDMDGNEMTFEQMELYENLSEGLAVQEQDGYYWYVDKKGNVVIPFQFEEADKFLGGFALVKWQGKYGIIRHPDAVSLIE